MKVIQSRGGNPAGADENRLLKATEVADFIGVKRATAYRLLDSGTLSVVRFGRSVRVRYRDLVEWIDANRTNPPQANPPLA